MRYLRKENGKHYFEINGTEYGFLGSFDYAHKLASIKLQELESHD
jgi:hypothetical protein